MKPRTIRPRRRTSRSAATLTFVGALFAAVLLSSPRVARAEPEVTDEDPAKLFDKATQAIAGERHGEAIALLEALGDRGIVDASASFNRGLAYALRVRGGGEQPGDLGRAAHGFDEARTLTHDASMAKEAERSARLVRAEVARRRARGGEAAPIDGGASLGRAIVDLLPENVWGGASALSALVLTIFVVVRALAGSPRAKVGANTTLGVSGALMALTALLAWSARDVRLHVRDGVVIAPAARLLDERHLAQNGVAPIAEGARVRLVEDAGGFSHVSAAGFDGYLPSSAVLPIAKR